MFDRLLALLKWPVAIVPLVLAPGMVYALSFVIRDIARSPGACAPFLLGAAAYAVMWLLLARRRIGFWATLEHELTHALFAWATFHPVVGFRATMRSGGH